jgi:transposase
VPDGAPLLLRHLPGINRFVNGVATDLDAVTAGLSLSFSSGPVEGNVNRIKMLKRQMYGRAGFDLSRNRRLVAFHHPRNQIAIAMNRRLGFVEQVR